MPCLNWQPRLLMIRHRALKMPLNKPLKKSRSEERRVGKECRNQRSTQHSSRRRHTSSLCDWSSDVCSSDLDIRIHMRRLQEEKDPAKRATAAQNLARLVNNPDALPELAAAFIDDSAQSVKDAAQQAAKEI